MNRFVAFLRDGNGSNAIEYSLMGTLLALAIIGVVSSLGTEVSSMFDTINSDL
jgi:pilus assembly protein Flp/PilA